MLMKSTYALENLKHKNSITCLNTELERNRIEINSFCHHLWEKILRIIWKSHQKLFT